MVPRSVQKVGKKGPGSSAQAASLHKCSSSRWESGTKGTQRSRGAVLGLLVMYRHRSLPDLEAAGLDLSELLQEAGFGPPPPPSPDEGSEEEAGFPERLTSINSTSTFCSQSFCTRAPSCEVTAAPSAASFLFRNSFCRRASAGNMDFQVVKRKHFFRSEVRILRFDGSTNTLLSHDEHGKAHKPISISRIKDIHKDHHHPLRLTIFFKGESRHSTLDFANENEIERFIDMIRLQRRVQEGDVEATEEEDSSSHHPHKHAFFGSSIFSKSWLHRGGGGDLSPRSAARAPSLVSQTSGASFASSFLGPLPQIGKQRRRMSDEYQEQRMRSEHSLRRDVHHNSRIFHFDPTELFTGSKLVAELSGGTIISAFPKDEFTGRAAIKKMVVPATARRRVDEQRNGEGEDGAEEDDVVEQLMQEVYSLGHSHHPNVVELFEGYVWDDAFNNRHVWMVMEYMTHQALTGCLENGWEKWDSHDEREGVVAYVAREVCNGLAYLHSFHRVHRDIKSDNIFVSDGGKVKIGDLGSCVHLTKEQSRRNSLRGTPNWLAPECIRQQLYDARVDVWGMGVTIIEMLEQDPPYFDEECMEAMRLIVANGCPPPQDPQRWSSDLLEFLSSCTQMDPEKRATSKELVDHTFVLQAVTAQTFEDLVRDCLGLPPLPRREHHATLHHVNTLS